MAHIHEKIDYTATALIVNDGKILLRFHDKYKVWLGIGGHIELDEDPVQGVIREVKEEAGLDIKILAKGDKTFPDGATDLLMPAFINKHHTNPDHEHIDFIYVATALTTDIHPITGAESEDVEFKWLTAEQLDDLKESLKPRTKYHALEALKIAQQYD